MNSLVVDVSANDVFSLWCYAEPNNSGTYSLLATNESANFPSTPSANINITQVAYNGPTGPTGPTVQIMNTFTPEYASNTITVNFLNNVLATASLPPFTGTISNYLFTGGVTNGEYVIIIPASGGSVTINRVSSGQTTYYFNFSTSIVVTNTHYGIMKVNYDGTRYYISCSAYNNN